MIKLFQREGSIILKIIIIFIITITYSFATVDINTATQKQLLDLNGIGKAKAAKIIKYREQNGCFESIDQLSNIDGISKKLVQKNSSNITISNCQKSEDNTAQSSQSSQASVSSSLNEVLFDPVNMAFVFVILLLAYIDQRYKKELKSQIVSIGVLGTFVGIFIGLQGFDPSDIINSVNHILVGLKTAFFTSIVGMSTATFLSIYQTLKS
jgi:competence ComEA-like helix-hairpin-helix protein